MHKSIQRLIAAVFITAVVLAPVAVFAQDAGPVDAGVVIGPVADLPDPAAEPGAALDVVYAAYKMGGWAAAAGVILGLLSIFLRPRLAKWSDFFKSTAGGYVMQAGLSLFVAAGDYLIEGDLSWRTASAAGVAFVVQVITSWGNDKRVQKTP